MHINWGIIGCGDVTEVKSGPAFKKVPGSSLMAVMRRNEEKVKDYAARHQVPKWYTNGEKLIDDPDVNAVYIATPPAYHEFYVIRALRAGKPVYVEKPMTMDARAAVRMMKAVQKANGKLSVAHYRRAQPLFKKVKELVQSEAVGKIRLVNLQLLQPHRSAMITQTDDNWRINPSISGGGLFHDLAPHQLDLMLYFFGRPLYAKGLSLNQAAHYAAADCTSGHIVFKNNIVFTGIWNFNVPASEKRDFCEIIGTEGKISFPVFEHQQVTLTAGDTTEVLPFEKLEHVQQPMIEQVVRYFAGHAENPCPVEDGVTVMSMIDAFTKRQAKVMSLV